MDSFFIFFSLMGKAKKGEPQVREITMAEYLKQQREKLAKLELNTSQRTVELGADFQQKFKLLEKEEEVPEGVKVAKKSNKKKKAAPKSKAAAIEVGFSFVSASDGTTDSRPDRGSREDRPTRDRAPREDRGPRKEKGDRRPKNDKPQGKKVTLSEDAFPSLGSN